MFRTILPAIALLAMSNAALADAVGNWQGFLVGKISRKTGGDLEKLPYFQNYSFHFERDGRLTMAVTDETAVPISITGKWRLKNTTIIASLDKPSLAAFYRSSWENLGYKVSNIKVSKASLNGEVLENGAGYALLLGKQLSNVRVTVAHPAFPDQNVAVREILEATYAANPVTP